MDILRHPEPPAISSAVAKRLLERSDRVLGIDASTATATSR
ncbi:MAG: hypothetical protein U1F20_03875 [Lysobacterales bacterium]